MRIKMLYPAHDPPNNSKGCTDTGLCSALNVVAVTVCEMTSLSPAPTPAAANSLNVPVCKTSGTCPLG